MEPDVSANLKLWVGAVITIIFECCCGHILEIFKISKQTTNKPVGEIYHLLTDQKGIVGLWDGFVPWGLLMALSKGASFSYGHQMAYNTLCSSFIFTSGLLSKKTIDIISSGLGGFFQGLLMSPLLLLKTRVVTHVKFRNICGGLCATIIASFKIGYEIITEHGPLALCKGMHIFSFKRFCDWLTRFLFVELTISALLMFGVDCKQSVILLTLAGLCGGTLSSLATTGLDVMTSMIQDHTKAEDQKIGFITLVTMMCKDRKGLRMATRGIYLRISHVALTTVVMKNSVPFACQLYMQWQSVSVAAKIEI